MSLLESDEEPGTEVVVQETRTTETFDAYVDEDGLVRAEFNGAAINAESHTIASIK